MEPMSKIQLCPEKILEVVRHFVADLAMDEDQSLVNLLLHLSLVAWDVMQEEVQQWLVIVQSKSFSFQISKLLFFFHSTIYSSFITKFASILFYFVVKSLIRIIRKAELLVCKDPPSCLNMSTYVYTF